MPPLPIPPSNDTLPPALVGLGRRREVPQGTLLFLQDEPAERCFFLEIGEVALRRVSRSGDEVEVARIEPGEWFGEALLFAGRGYPVQATVVRLSRFLEFRRGAILSSLNPEVSVFFLSLLARKCLALNHRIQELTVMDARERVARFLLGLCPGRADGCPGGRQGCHFPLPKKKVEIALELGMAPETLSRALGQMEKDGYLKVAGSQVEVPSCGRLKSLIQAE